LLGYTTTEDFNLGSILQVLPFWLSRGDQSGHLTHSLPLIQSSQARSQARILKMKKIPMLTQIQKMIVWMFHLRLLLLLTPRGELENPMMHHYHQPGQIPAFSLVAGKTKSSQYLQDGSHALESVFAIGCRPKHWQNGCNSY
jgi:hypothetical protein